MKTKNIILGLFGFFMYFFLNIIELLPFEIANVDINYIPNYIKISYLIIYEIMEICILLLIFSKQIITNFKDILKNHKMYFSKYFKYYLIGLAVMLISNFIIIFILDGGVADNEETIRNMFKISPLYIYFSSVIYAPIVEELTFRQALRNIVGKNFIFIILSGLIFGGLHLSNITSIVDLLYLIPYGSLGFVFAYILYKTDNIFISMGLHFMHNGILISLQFLTLLFA